MNFFAQNLKKVLLMHLGTYAKFRQLAIVAIFVATFDGVIRMKLITPFFQTEFDPQQVSFCTLAKFRKLAIFGGYFWCDSN